MTIAHHYHAITNTKCRQNPSFSKLKPLFINTVQKVMQFFEKIEKTIDKKSER